MEGRRPLLALLIAVGLGIPFGETKAQAPSAAEVATPVEITADVLNGDVLRGPRNARLPARDLLELRVVNRAPEPIWLVAPKFFQASQHIESAGFAYDLVQGGFLAAPRSTVRVLLRSPPSNEYYYSCFRPGQAPTPESSGF